MHSLIDSELHATTPLAGFIGRERLTAGDAVAHASPIDGAELTAVSPARPAQVELAIAAAEEAFHCLRLVPAPRRGELVRRLGLQAREHKEALAGLIALESGKLLEEARGEVQEMIDICDFAAGLSRQLHGLTIASERPGHRMMEQWHPLGPVGVITAFNFPVAVWAWNAAIALVCGDPVLWKPAPQTPLCALACHKLLMSAMAEMPDLPPAAASVLPGGREVGEQLAGDHRLPLISATGSCAMGRELAARVAGRLGRLLLELGGNNALILAPGADLDLALRAIVFAAVGTTGQRCTSLRRLIVHESLIERVGERLSAIYQRLPIGDPRSHGILVGPLVSAAAGDAMQRAIEQARREGGQLLCGGERLGGGVPAGGCYMRPALLRMPAQTPIVQEETFAPILYMIGYRELEEAIALNNGVPQGLSSALFTRDLQEAERFLGPAGSDCGIANINIGTSGAEIGGAFGGEKDTGGGRESGSDAWKAYMRRATNTINYSRELPLAQGICFDL